MTDTPTRLTEEQEQRIKDLLALPYSTVLQRDEDGDIVARIGEWLGCVCHGATVEEALALLEESKRVWVEQAVTGGCDIPPPSTEGIVHDAWKLKRQHDRALAEIDALRAERDDLQRSYDALATQANALENDREYNASLWQEMKAERDRLLAHVARLKEALLNMGLVRMTHYSDFDMGITEGYNRAVREMREALASPETGEA